ncbi:hypothetical protein F5B22DRAFT_598712 [Xylaria bambusicola]|uniref:uncharacterized protein n=1 Tax=Xylaria bambusicola TaxID=326684 RepID=UPI00200761DD|nr:uncharacterized protein F5B22DRAFT_598712 [Xylaria bambusicola]KAI0520893.1 hypothetical protein F5B22DRAFT_598712 [Xylaria bambusicola]
MGGLAFSSGPNALSTPRMRPEVYRAVRDRCQAKLRELFLAVATPIEGPAKDTFGDIDMIVAYDKYRISPVSEPDTSTASVEAQKEAVSRALGAIRCKTENPNTMSMAIPWPKDFPCEETVPESNGPVCIQVDTHFCKSLDNFYWMLFRHAHGVIWNIIGSTIRPLGLTVDEVGFHIRIPELEEINKKKAKVLLTTNSEEALNFLGLKFDDKQWEEPFASDQDLYEYVATCRLFWVKRKAARASSDDKNVVDLDNLEIKEDDEVADDKRMLKANDRRRMAQRPLFKKWIEEFLPACRVSGRYPSTCPTRDEVREQVFGFFPGVRSIYYTTLANWLVERQRQTLWKAVIKPAIPEDIEVNRRGCCAAALKKIILNDDTRFDGIAAPSNLKDSNGIFDEALVRAWVEKIWPVVSDIAWRINQERSMASQLHKEAAKRTGSGEERPAKSVKLAEDHVMNSEQRTEERIEQDGAAAAH